jgi:Zn-dependent protease with chaperone function
MDDALVRGRYYDGKSASVRIVTVRATPGELILRDAGDQSLVARWPIVELRVLGDAEHEAVPLLVRGNDPARLVIEDAAERRALAADVPEIARLGAVRPRGMQRILQFGTALVAALVLVWVGIDQGSGVMAPLVPYGAQARLGETVYRQLVAQRELCRGKEGMSALVGFANRLASAADYDHPVQIRVVRGGPINAFTLPGGIIVLYSDMIDRMNDANELGGVLAHEMGHVVHYHPMQALARQYGVEQILKAVTGGYSDLGTLQSGGTLLLAMRNGRSFEREADATGVSLLERLGLRADGMARFFESLLKGEPADAAATAGILSDHPPTQERIDATRRPATGAPDFAEKDWQSIRAICR